MTAAALAAEITAWPWAEGAAVLFGFVWGAMLGSFVNVVVHRLPRGESVVTARSRCPRCGAVIRPWDNVPVLGWLWLGGRCRDCGAAIAATYPLVEAACGGAVMLLAGAELAAGGAWLPASAGEHLPGIDRLLRGDWQLLAVFLLHAAVVVTVMAWSLLDGVGWRLPRPHLAAAILLAVTAVATVPAAAPPPIWPVGSASPPTWAADRLVTSLAGALAGALAASLTAGLQRSPALGQGRRWGLPLLGSVLGWQGLAGVEIAAAVGTRVGGWGAAAAGLWLAAAGTLGLAFSGPLQLVWEAFGLGR